MRSATETEPLGTAKRRQLTSSDAAAIATDSLLLRHIHCAYNVLFSLLSPRDTATLLSSSRTLRQDANLVDAAMRLDPLVRHYDHRCQQNWICVPPLFVPGESCAISADNPQPIASNLDTARKLALFSLINSMDKALGHALRKSYSVYTLDVRPTPFVWLTELPSDCTAGQVHAQLNGLHRGLGDALITSRQRYVTSIGLHLQHSTASQDRGSARACRLCDAVVQFEAQYMKENNLYWDGVQNSDDSDRCDYAHRDLNEDGYYQEQFYYRYDASEELFSFLLTQHQASRLVAMVDELRDPEEQVKTMLPDYTAALCPEVLTPLVQYFHSHGFRRIVHARLPVFQRPNGEEYDRVELIGGVSPSGLFAGLLLPHMYT